MSRLNLYLNDGVDGKYYSAPQIIILEKTTRENLIKLHDDPHKFISSFKILCHEIRHLFDNVETSKITQ
jgi:hypothetical protein